MRKIGLHLRFDGSLLALARKAQLLQLPFFQCFLMNSDGDHLLQPSEQEVREFLQLRQYFEAVYVHGSYWINLAGKTHGGGLRALQRELRLAKQLEFSHMVLHPGYAKGFATKQQGIGLLARTLNDVLKKEHDVTFVLENTAHGGLSIGGDIQDFALLREYLDHPEKIEFCIDTAHAHSYGYDLINEASREAFIAELDAAIGLDAINLIHLNDTSEPIGSKIDKHQLIGQGLMGEAALKNFALHSKVMKNYLLLEPPLITAEQELQVLEMLRSW